MVIGLTGLVGDATVVRSSGVPYCDSSARSAVRQWQFAPTLLDGVAVSVIMTVTVKFQPE